jgi:hypothetical protein
MNTVSVPIRPPCFTHLNFRSLCLQPPTSLSLSLLHVTPQLIEFPDYSGPGFTITQQAHQPWQAESSSLSYGWIVRLLLLPTPPHDDAVAVGYRPENVCLKGTCTPLFSTIIVRLQAHWVGASAPTLEFIHLSPLSALA